MNTAKQKTFLISFCVLIISYFPIRQNLLGDTPSVEQYYLATCSLNGLDYFVRQRPTFAHTHERIVHW